MPQKTLETSALPNPFPAVCHFFGRRISIDCAVCNEELLLSKKMSFPERQKSFLTGRFCAHQAIKAAGKSDGPILFEDSGMPIWPESTLCGSITHGGGYAAAAVLSDTKEYIGIGIDLEHKERIVPPKVAVKVLTEQEKAYNCPVETLIRFSAKESVYKALYPHFRIGMGFCDAEIKSISLDSFQIVLSERFLEKTQFKGELIGKIQVTDGVLLTSVIWVSELRIC